MSSITQGLARFQKTKGTIPISAEAPEKFRDAPFYDADEELQTAVELALELKQPLLITGEPGCGKTAAAYWAAWALGLDAASLHHVQIRSSATAADMKYEFDNIGYLRESQVAGSRKEAWTPAQEEEVRRRFVRPGPLWSAFESARKHSIILLLDEIDKAPRDFPNDLLHEFDQLEFEVPEWRVEGQPLRVSARPAGGPARASATAGDPSHPFILMVFTSNGERRLPDAFLRRCVHHHLAFDEQRMLNIVRHRADLARKTASGQKLPMVELTDAFIEYAVKRFMVLKRYPELNHQPGLAELLIWLRVVASRGGIDIERLKAMQPGELPYLGLLLKDAEDRRRVQPSLR
jgi:MoxR-like ATPase